MKGFEIGTVTTWSAPVETTAQVSRRATLRVWPDNELDVASGDKTLLKARGMHLLVSVLHDGSCVGMDAALLDIKKLVAGIETSMDRD